MNFSRIKNKKAAFILCLLIFVFSTVPSLVPEELSAQIPFGGPITYINYAPGCFEGQQIYIGPPGPVGSYMYSGAMSYASGPPSHVGQFLLGMAAGYLTCSFYCGVSVCVIPGGYIILYHGSSA